MSNRARFIRRDESNDPKVISEVNLTPMVDMALTLLIVFLIFLPMTLTKLIPITGTPPGGGGPSTPAAPETPLVVILSPDKAQIGGFAFTSEDKMIPWLRDQFIQRRDHKLIVKTGPDVQQQRLVTLLDDVRQSGEWKVSLSLLEEKGP